MKNKATYLFLLLLVLSACGSPDGDSVEEKKSKLDDLKTEVKKLNDQIASLEKDIAVKDSTFGKDPARNAVLVTTLPVRKKKFEHKIEMRGSVESRKNVMLSPEVSGKVQSISVQEGQKVRKNQVLITLNSDIAQNNISELRTSLELANAVYKRQKNLWDKKIGTEIQYLEAKNKKESLENRLATANSQLAQSVIRAPFDGIIDAIPARIGEVSSPGSDLIRIVNPDAMYIQADASERFVGSFKKGDSVDVFFPSRNIELGSTVTSISGIIDQNNRTYSLEVKLPKVDFAVKPNQVTVLRLKDYENPDAIAIPTRVIQEDQEGSFVFIAEDKNAKKVHVSTGVSYEGQTEIVDGLAGNEVLIDKGVTELTDGTLIEVSKESAKVASK